MIACNDNQFLEYDTKASEPQLSLSGFVCEDSIYVCLTETFQAEYMMDDTISTTIVTDTSATVTIYEDGSYFCTLQAKSIKETHWATGEITSKNYYVAYNSVIPGKKYVVSVTHGKYGSLSAETRMPIIPLISVDTQLVYQKVTLNKFTPSEIIYYDTMVWNTYFTLALQDQEVDDSFYKFDFQINVINIAKIGLKFNDANTLYNDEYLYYLLTDKNFNGGTYDLVFSVFQPYADSISVDFTCLSADYYNYLISMIAYHEAERDPFSKPVNLYSNVSNGFGFFGAYQKFRFQNY